MDLDAMNQATAAAAQQGIHVLNAFLLADTEEAHVAQLLRLMDPPEGAVVIDAGCGVGAVAQHMLALRPDLQFKLVNISQEQLQLCPEGMERVAADYARMPFEDGAADVVMFNFALCHADDWMAALRETRRVLKEGGILFVFDMVRSGGSNVLMQQALHARAFTVDQVADIARRAGLEPDEVFIHEPQQLRLRDVFADPALYDLAFAGVAPATFRCTKRTLDDPVASAFHRHSRIAFQFSAGRDSTAALYLLRPYWGQLELYHLDTGDQFPETREVFARVAAEFEEATGRAPRIIHGEVSKVRGEHGMPSDLVPVDNTTAGQLVSGRELRLQGRYECCWRALMQPMHQRMIADGITLIIRGQRDDEYAAPPKRSGDTGDGFEVLYPIQSWNADQVMAYLQDNGLPVAQFYERGVRRAPECMGCTAWWDEGRAAYLRQYHPVHFEAYAERMGRIRAEIDRQYRTLET